MLGGGKDELSLAYLDPHTVQDAGGGGDPAFIASLIPPTPSHIAVSSLEASVAPAFLFETAGEVEAFASQVQALHEHGDCAAGDLHAPFARRTRILTVVRHRAAEADEDLVEALSEGEAGWWGAPREAGQHSWLQALHVALVEPLQRAWEAAWRGMREGGERT